MKQFIMLMLTVLIFSCGSTAVKSNDINPITVDKKVERTYQKLDFSSKLKPGKISKRLNAAGRFLLRMLKNSGRFEYEYNVYRNRFSEDDNIVRQGGTSMIMGRLYKWYNKKRYAEGVKKAFKYYLTRTKTETKNGTTYRFNDTRKTGADALYLLAFLSLHNDKDWWNKNYTELKQVIDMLLFVQKENGGIAKYFPERPTKNEVNRSKESGYYTGEVLLCYIELYTTIMKTDEMKNRIEKLFKHLKNLFDKKDYRMDKGLLLWLTQSVRGYLDVHYDKEIAKFGSDFVKRYLVDNNLLNRTTSYTILEALAHSLFYVQDYLDKSFLKKLFQKTTEMAKTGLELQVMDSSTSGIKRQRIKNFKVAKGGFVNSIKRGEQRIDTTQHCISAYKAICDYIILTTKE